MLRRRSLPSSPHRDTRVPSPSRLRMTLPCIGLHQLPCYRLHDPYTPIRENRRLEVMPWQSHHRPPYAFTHRRRTPYSRTA
jgi:hypothetical protein